MFNCCILVGRLAEDPKLINYEDQYCVTNIVLAVARPFKNQDGVVDTDFIKVSLWDSFARNTCDYCRKGDLVAVRARIQNKPLELNVMTDNGVQTKKYNMSDLIGERIVFLQTSHHNTDEDEENNL